MKKRIKQQYGIKYPFTADQENGSFLDVNTDIKSKIRSIVMHVVFTPKGQKIRDPQFGTDLIKYIFEPNEEGTWGQLRNSVSSAISQNLPMVSLNTIDVLKNEDDPNEAFVKIVYSIKVSNTMVEDSIVTKI